VFEFESERLGAQAALGGGGRYDGLVEELGGPPTPGVGFAAGIERMLMAAGDETGEPAERLFIAIAKPDATRTGFQLARLLREAGFRVETEQAGRSLKGQLKQADRIGAFATVILGDSIEVKDMETGDQRAAGSLDEVLGMVREVTRA
jgi:histidyl-tRNA synthetase